MVSVVYYAWMVTMDHLLHIASEIQHMRATQRCGKQRSFGIEAGMPSMMARIVGGVRRACSG